MGAGPAQGPEVRLQLGFELSPVEAKEIDALALGTGSGGGRRGSGGGGGERRLRCRRCRGSATAVRASMAGQRAKRHGRRD
jgi:hypothetical protein